MAAGFILSLRISRTRKGIMKTTTSTSRQVLSRVVNHAGDNIAGFVGQVSIPDDQELHVEEVQPDHAERKHQLAQIVKLLLLDKVSQTHLHHGQGGENGYDSQPE